jgi:hypothetical protein
MKEDYKYVLMFPLSIRKWFYMPGTGITIQLWIVTVDILDIKEKEVFQPFGFDSFGFTR